MNQVNMYIIFESFKRKYILVISKAISKILFWILIKEINQDQKQTKEKRLNAVYEGQ